MHFEGRLWGEQAFVDLLKRVREIANAKTWLTEGFENTEVTLLRVRADEEEWDYTGPTKGIVVYLHEDCDPVRLEFDRDLYVQEFVKTQFAGVFVHSELVRLLRDVRPFFVELKVDDEGEYWDRQDEEVLADHIRHCDEAIADLRRQNPDAQVKVRDPRGRLMDLIE